MTVVLPMPKKRTFEFFPRRPNQEPRPWYLLQYLKQVPFGHILGEYRYALLRSPCCARRLRVYLYSTGRGWTYRDNVRCGHCRRIWTVKLVLTGAGFASRAELSLGSKDLRNPG